MLDERVCTLNESGRAYNGGVVTDGGEYNTQVEVIAEVIIALGLVGYYYV